MVAITPGVQNLHRDLAALGMHRFGHLAVLCSLAPSGKFAGERFYPASPVRRVTARDNQTDITPGAFGKVGRQTVMFVAVFKPRVHRAHEHPVLQRCEAKIEWGEKVGVLVVGHT